MTRLPVDSWDVTPRLDIPPYALNTICPVTGEVSGLEDHHIFRRSFTALGQGNEELYWVGYLEQRSDLLIRHVVKNRVALSPEAHLRITTNVARLEYRETDLYYVEDEEEKLLNLDLHLMADGESVSKRRRAKQASTPEERKARKNFTIRTPNGEEMVIPELVEELRQVLPKRETAPSYFVVVDALAFTLQHAHLITADS